LPARICSTASLGSTIIISTWPPSSAASRSPPEGNEMNCQRAPVFCIRSCRTVFSRDMIEPPDHLSLPGLAFAASMNWPSDLYGESASTTTSAGSTTSRAIGLMSCRRLTAACCTSGSISQMLVKHAMTCGSFFLLTT
jgi:hypothetical protein